MFELREAVTVKWSGEDDPMPDAIREAMTTFLPVALPGHEGLWLVTSITQTFSPDIEWTVEALSHNPPNWTN